MKTLSQLKAGNGKSYAAYMSKKYSKQLMRIMKLVFDRNCTAISVRYYGEVVSKS